MRKRIEELLREGFELSFADRKVTIRYADSVVSRETWGAGCFNETPKEALVQAYRRAYLWGETRGYHIPNYSY